MIQPEGRRVGALVGSAVMDSSVPKHLQSQIESLKVLFVDDDHFMRKVVRTMLSAIGVRTVFEACDGLSGLQAIRDNSPDLVIVDWEMPKVDGPQFVWIIRSPGALPMPDIPIIILTGHGDRWRVIEAARVGVHEYLLKPVSTKALLDRVLSILTKPRAMVSMEGYYGPEPRKLVIISTKPELSKHEDVVMLN